MSLIRDAALVARGCGPELRLELPLGVFSPPAEQLRWDALRTGHLEPSKWSGARAEVAPVRPEAATSGDGFAFVFTLTGSVVPVRKVYRPAQLQRLRMLLASRLPSGGTVDAVDIHWPHQAPLQVPLGPVAMPLPGAERRSPRSDLPGMCLEVSTEVQDCLSLTARLSQSRGVEMGGALLGRLRSVDELAMESALFAAEGASPDSFRFAPRFWLRLQHVCRRRRQRIVGWFHSHLCDRGHPAELSIVDLQLMHAHFALPWLVSALVCVCKDRTQVRWYQWADGAVVETRPRHQRPLLTGAGASGEEP